MKKKIIVGVVILLVIAVLSGDKKDEQVSTSTEVNEVTDTEVLNTPEPSGVAVGVVVDKEEDHKISITNKIKTPVNLGSPINTLGWEDAPSISPDGNTLYFTIGENLDVDSYYSKKSGGKWSKPKPHSFNTDDLPEGAVHTQDNKLLYFAAIRADSIGSADIYIFENGQVKNIGAPINTKDLESEPYISPDGNTLYFGSNRSGSKGADIWFSKKVGGVWQEPVNIGEPVNSDKDETQPFVTADGNEIYFTATNRNGVGGPAIFMSKKQGEVWGEPELVVSGFVGEPTLTADGKFLYFVHLFVINNKPVDADIYVAEVK